MPISCHFDLSHKKNSSNFFQPLKNITILTANTIQNKWKAGSGPQAAHAEPGPGHLLDTRGRAVPCYPNRPQADLSRSLLATPGREGVPPCLNHCPDTVRHMRPSDNQHMKLKKKITHIAFPSNSLEKLYSHSNDDSIPLSRIFLEFKNHSRISRSVDEPTQENEFPSPDQRCPGDTCREPRMRFSIS